MATIESVSHEKRVFEPPREFANHVTRLAPDEGLNALAYRHATRLVSCEKPEILDDLDTPDDYRRLQNR